MELGQIIYDMNMARREMDECWVELETASDWEHIKEISARLAEAGLRYKELKKQRADLTYGEVSATIVS